MASDTVYRKLNKYEWAESALAKGVVQQPGSLVKEVLGGAVACSERKMYVFGGYDPRTGRSLSQLLEFDITAKLWSRGVSIPENVRDGAAIAFGESCLIFGGWNDETYSKNLWLFSPKNPEALTANSKDPVVYTWSLVQPAAPIAPSARVYHSMVVASMPTGEADGSSVPVAYLFGGFDGEKRLNDVWRLRLTPLVEKGLAEWELVEINGGTPPTPRDAAAVAFDAANERLVVFGGFSEALKNDLYTLNLRGGENKWTYHSCTGVPSRRQSSVAAVSSGCLVVCLGEDDNGAVPQILQLSMTDLKWSLLSLEKEDLAGRKGAMGCVSDKGKRIMIFGGGGPPKFHSSVLELELEKADGGSRKK